jgi:hypothetical protein
MAIAAYCLPGWERGGHRLGEILVRLIECLTRFAAQPQPCGDHSIGGSGELPGQVVEPGELAFLRSGAALRVVFADFTGQIAADLDGARDDAVHVEGGQPGLMGVRCRDVQVT